MKRNRKLLLTTVLSILLLLGVFVGASITTFILFLNKHDNLLAILSYLFLAVFTVLIIVESYLFYKYRDEIFSKEGNIHEEE